MYGRRRVVQSDLAEAGGIVLPELIVLDMGGSRGWAIGEPGTSAPGALRLLDENRAREVVRRCAAEPGVEAELARVRAEAERLRSALRHIREQQPTTILMPGMEASLLVMTEMALARAHEIARLALDTAATAARETPKKSA